MKHIFRIFASLSVIAAAASCQQFDVDTQMSPEKFAASVKLESDVLESYTLSATDPQAIIFNVTSNTPWTISGGAEWLSVTPSTSGAAGLIADVTVTAQKNTTLEDRSTTLTLKSDSYNTRTYIVTIKQNRMGKLFVQPIYKQFSAEGGPLPFTIETNNAWEVRSSQGWLTFGSNSGQPNPDGSALTVIATAEANEGTDRTATVTVVSGDEEESFEVVQAGMPFNIVVPQTTVFEAEGGEIVIEVNTLTEWTPKALTEGCSVEKIDAKSFKAVVSANPALAERKVAFSIESPKGLKDQVEFTQKSAFELENCEVLEDGSVKLSADKCSRIIIPDNYRMVNIKAVLGEKHFGSAAQCWFQGKFNDVNIYNQLAIGVNFRLRMDGNMANGVSAYKNATYSITADELNAMETYEVKMAPAGENVTMSFIVNGTEKASSSSFLNPFYYDTTSKMTDAYFGFYSISSDGSWFVVKSLSVEDVAEPYL